MITGLLKPFFYQSRIIRKKTCSTHNDAKAEKFYFIERLYNLVCKHGGDDMLSAIEYEKRYS